MADQCIALRHFPVRVNYEPGESLAGYLHRSHCINGHRLPEGMLKAIEHLGGSATVAQLALNTLSDVVGDADTVRKAWLPVAGARRYASSTCRPLLRAVRTLLYCPSCIGAERVHRQLWEMPGVRACATHYARLLDSCGVCRTRLTWRTVRPDWTCICGAPLAEAATDEPEAEDLFFSRLVHEMLAAGSGEVQGIYHSVVDGVDLLKRVTGGRGPREVLPGAYVLLHRLLSDPSSVAREVAQALHQFDENLIVLGSRHYLNAIDWATDARCRGSLLRDELASAVEAFHSDYQVDLRLGKKHLYDVRVAPAENVERLKAFGRWWGCWCGWANARDCISEADLFDGSRDWHWKDVIVAEVVNELYRAFRLGDGRVRHEILLCFAGASAPYMVRDPRHVVAAMWKQLRPLSRAGLQNYLGLARKHQGTGCPA